MSENLLSVRNLTKVFSGRGSPDFLALDDVSFDLSQGESLGIVGESGSGKSTTARIVVGIEQATSGSVSFAGVQPHRAKKLADRRLRAKQAQMVFQDPFGSLDVNQRLGECLREVIAVHGSPDGLSSLEYARSLLDQVGLSESHENSFPRQLSGGQRQRFAIARALTPRPRLLILDEAVSALDVSIQAQILELLVELREKHGMSYLFVSHDLAVVRQVCDRVLVMRAGRIVEMGDVDEVLLSPRAQYTQDLIAAVPGPGWKPPARRR